MMAGDPLVLWFAEIDNQDAGLVGGKAASLGEMYRALTARGVRIPNGFAVTTDACRALKRALLPAEFLAHFDGLSRAFRRGAVPLQEVLESLLAGADTSQDLNLHERCVLARQAILATPIPTEVEEALQTAYRQLAKEAGREVELAVRSSATCEDSQEASFAGQFDSYLNVRGEAALLDHWRRCVASLFTERVVNYQLSGGLDPLESALGVVVMRMVRSDQASSGVIFTLDPDSGHRGVVHVTAAWGLGELVVQGAITPDTFVLWKEGLRRGRPALVHTTLGEKEQRMVYAGGAEGLTSVEKVLPEDRRRPALATREVLQLGQMALAIEEHYGRPMDIEWAKDGPSGELFIVQARPETVHAQKTGHGFELFQMDPELVSQLKADGKLLLEGQAVGTRIGSGPVRIYRDYDEVLDERRRVTALLEAGRREDELPPENRVFCDGDVLVTGMTTPDWEPMMKRASLIITEKGGRTSHAAIIAREFGIPAILGCRGAMELLEPLMEVTGSCAEGDVGRVYAGRQPFQVETVELDEEQPLRTRIKLNVGFPKKALADARLPADGVGLARIEFILTSEVGIHPLALFYYKELEQFVVTREVPQALAPYARELLALTPEEGKRLLLELERRVPGDNKRSFFVDRLREGVALICAAFHPRPVLVRLSDLKSNEYRALLGGNLFEPLEENPMIAWRGASRYNDPRFKPAFQMECEALRAVRAQLGLDNLQVMVPFCRTPEEGAAVRALLEEEGLGREAGVPLFLMMELPSNVILAEDFMTGMGLAGGSIGTNDLVQTLYAVSRDDLEGYTHGVDARSPAARAFVAKAIKSFTEAGLEIGICGQAPSDHPDEIPPFLVANGITSISVTADTLLQVRRAVARAEAELEREDQPSRQRTGVKHL